MGTVAYMSPEQARAKELDSRSDLFSFGAVLYEMSTGSQAFQGESVAIVFDTILNRHPLPPSQINPQLPSEVERIIRRALEKDRALRYQHASEMRAELQRVKRDTSSGARPSAHAERPESVAQPPFGDSEAAPAEGFQAGPILSSRGSVGETARRHKLGAAAVLGTMIILLAAAGYSVRSVFRRRTAVPFQHFTITPITDNRITERAAISPDGKYVLSDVGVVGNDSLWLHHIPTNSDTQIIAPSDAVYWDLEFSPDGNYFCFHKEEAARGVTNLYRASVLGSNPQVIVRDIDSNASFSADGKHIVYERANDPDAGRFQLLEANSDGTDEKMIAAGPISSFHRNIAWSPDGKLVALTDGSGAPSKIQLFELSTGRVTDFVLSKKQSFFSSIWIPDGRGLFVLYQDLMSGQEQSQIGFISYPDGEFHTVTIDTNDYQSLTLSADAKTLATAQLRGRTTFHLVPASGGVADSSIPPKSQDMSSFLGWAGSDGFYLGEHDRLERISTDGSKKALLLDKVGIGGVSACPNGHTLLVSITGQGSEAGTKIWRVDTDGTQLKQLSNGQHDDGPACSPDSRWAYYLDSAAARIARVPLDGGSAETVPGTEIPHINFASDPALSPDGKSIAFLVGFGDGTTVPKIAVVPLGRGPRPQVRMIDPDPGIWYGPSFAPDGKALVYAARHRGMANLWLQPMNGAAEHQITNFKSDEMINIFQWSPDGRTLAVLAKHREADVVLLRDSNGKTL